MKTALLIPIHNESSRIEKLLEESGKFIVTKNIIIVDDGSTDGSLNGISEKIYTIIRHPRNMGKGKALQTGFKAASEAGFDWVITMDGDGQHLPIYIPELIAKAGSADYGLIIGSRRSDLSGMPLDRKLSNLTTSFILSLIAGRKIPDAQCGYRMYKMDFIRDIELKTTGFDTENELLLAAFRRKINIGWVDIETIYANEGSHIHRISDTFKFIKLIIKYLIGMIY